jgi:hypothetical protein
VNKKRRLLKEYYEREAENGRCERNEIDKHLNTLNAYINEDKHAINIANTNNIVWRFIKIRVIWWWETTKSLWTGYDNYIITKRHGRDISVYLHLQRLLIWSFTLITFLAMVILIPLHTTGSLPANYDSFESQYANVSARNRNIGETVPDKNIVVTSVNMVLESPEKMAAHVILAFIFLVIFLGIIVLGMMLSPIVDKFNYAGQDEPEDSDFRNKLNTDYNMENGDMTGGAATSRAQLLSPFTVEVLGLPSTLIKQSVLRKVLVGLIGGNQHQIAHISLIHDFSKRAALKLKLEGYEEKLDQYEHKLAQLQQDRLLNPPAKLTEFETAYINSRKLSLHQHFKRVDGQFHLFRDIDGLEFYRQKVDWLRYKIARWDKCFREQTQEDVSTDEIQEEAQEHTPQEQVDVKVENTVQGDKERQVNQQKDRKRTLSLRLHKQKQLDNLSVMVTNVSNKIVTPKNDSKEKNYAITASGVAYVTFKSLDALNNFMKNYKQKGFNFTFTSEQPRTKAEVAEVVAHPQVGAEVQAQTQETVTVVEEKPVELGTSGVEVGSISGLQNIGNSLEQASTPQGVIKASQLDALNTDNSFAKSNYVRQKLATLRDAASPDKKLLSRIVEKITIFVNRIDYEPNDIVWETLYSYLKITRYLPVIRQVVLSLIVVLIIIFFSSPLAVVSSIQQFLALSWVNTTVSAVITLTGPLGNLFFQYLPTLLLLIVSSIVPTLFTAISTLAKKKTKTKAIRTTTQRFYVYLIISTLILPTILLSSISALVNYFIAFNGNVGAALALLFVPSSGTFFINYILQKALLKNVMDIIRIDLLIYHAIRSRFTDYTKYYIYYAMCCFLPWCYHRHDKFVLHRFMSPRQRLHVAEFSWNALFLDWEYPYLLSVAGIALVFSLFSPIILCAATLYFLLKFYVDRYVICYHFGHRVRQPCVKSSNFLALRKTVFQLMRIIIGTTIMFCVYLVFFFATKIAGDNKYIIHTVFCAIFLGITIAIMVFFDILCRLWLNRARALLKRGQLKSDQLEENTELPITSKPLLSLDDIRTQKLRFYDPPILFEVMGDTLLEKMQTVTTITERSPTEGLLSTNTPVPETVDDSPKQL